MEFRMQYGTYCILVKYSSAICIHSEILAIVLYELSDFLSIRMFFSGGVAELCFLSSLRLL